MRTRRFITAGAATAATLMLLAASPNPTNASPSLAEDATSNPGITQVDHVVVASVQSRAQQNPDVLQGNALEIRNETGSPVALADWRVEVYDSGSNETASYEFSGAITLASGKSFVLRDPDFFPTPRAIPDARMDQLDSAASDTILDDFGVSLIDASGVIDVQVDSLATVDGIVDGNGNPVGEGTEATALDGNTDPFNAAIRRSVLYQDGDDNRTDFHRRPAMWGVPL